MGAKLDATQAAIRAHRDRTIRTELDRGNVVTAFRVLMVDAEQVAPWLPPTRTLADGRRGNAAWRAVLERAAADIAAALAELERCPCP